METGYRERQARSPITNRVMRFEPRPGYTEADPTINNWMWAAVGVSGEGLDDPGLEQMPEESL